MCVTCWKLKDECKCFCPPFKIDSYETEQEAIKLNKDNLPYQQIEDIDDLMYPTLCILNSKGYETAFSCSGHPDDTSFDVYILFKKIYKFDTIPVDFKASIDMEHSVIRFRLTRTELLKRQKRRLLAPLIDKLNNELLEWTNNLPSIDGK